MINDHIREFTSFSFQWKFWIACLVVMLFEVMALEGKQDWNVIASSDCQLASNGLSAICDGTKIDLDDEFIKTNLQHFVAGYNQLTCDKLEAEFTHVKKWVCEFKGE